MSVSGDPALDTLLKLAVLAVVSIISYRLRFLDARGFVASLAVGSAVLFLGGWRLFALLLLFLLVGSLLTKVLNGGGGIRGWRNVLANGGWAAASASLYGLSGSQAALLFFLGTLNAMFSDTVSTEVGMYLGGKPRLITKPWLETRRGLSGGVTVPGLLGGISGAILFSYLSLYMFRGELDASAMVSVACAGILANVLDSLLGATLQAKYRCGSCGEVVEEERHCGSTAVLISGYRGVDNHVVNMVSSLAGGLLALGIYFFLSS